MAFEKGDFHLHTTASDGRLSPEELVSVAVEKGLDIMAVTDHDTTLGVAGALAQGERLGIKVIPGIELSTTHNGESIHMLGYFRDATYKSEEFQNFLSDMKNSRLERGKKIIGNLQTCFGIKLDYDKIYREAKGVIARPHIARAILEAGYDYSWDYIFENLIGNNSPAYVPNKKITIPEGIKLLKSVNSTVILAHPVLIRKSSVEDILQYDFDGLEAIYPLNSEENTRLFQEIAKDRNLIITAGSDFHGGDEGDTKHGIIGNIYLQKDNIKKFLELSSL